MVLAAMVGVSFVSIAPATLGLFMEPLQNEFAWTRTQISAGMMVLALVSLALMPFAGAVVDRLGTRRVALPGLVLGALAFAAFGLMEGSLVQWFATWVAFTLATLMCGLLVFSTAVSATFTGSRGLALALVLCGAALAQALAPIVSRALIDSFGWRTAYVGLGAGWGGVAFLLCLLLFRQSRPRPVAGQPAGADATAGNEVGGLTVKDALRSPRMYRIALATLLQTLLGAAAAVHAVPMLTSSGLTRADAASVAALLGVSSICGKLLTGWLVDRIDGAWLPALCYGGPGLAYLLLLQGTGSSAMLAAAIVILGYCSGAALQLTTYLTSRYAGLRHFGKIFGLMSMLLALGGGFGPILAGVVFDANGNYSFLFAAGIVAGLAAGLSVIGLGPYPQFGPVADATRPPFQDLE